MGIFRGDQDRVLTCQGFRVMDPVDMAFYEPRADRVNTTGDDGLVEYGWRAGKSTRNKGMCETEHKLSDTLKDRFRIYFPTAETVANSRGGIGVWNYPQLRV